MFFKKANIYIFFTEEILKNYGLKEEIPIFREMLRSIDLPISTPNCRLHVMDLGSFLYLIKFFFQLSEEGIVKLQF